MKRKMLAIMLALCLVLTLLPLGAMAADTETVNFVVDNGTPVPGLTWDFSGNTATITGSIDPPPPAQAPNVALGGDPKYKYLGLKIARPAADYKYANIDDSWVPLDNASNGTYEEGVYEYYPVMVSVGEGDAAKWTPYSYEGGTYSITWAKDANGAEPLTQTYAIVNAAAGVTGLPTVKGSVIASNLVDHNPNATPIPQAELYKAGTYSAIPDGHPETNTVDVAVSVEDLKAHYSANVSLGSHYWAGIGIEQAAGNVDTTYAVGFGQFNAANAVFAAAADARDNTQTENGQTYDTFYFGLDNEGANAAYIAAKYVKDSCETTIVYNIDFSGVKFATFDAPILVVDKAGNVAAGFTDLNAAIASVDPATAFTYVELREDINVSNYTEPIILPDGVTLTGGEAGHTIYGNPASTDVYFNVVGFATLANLTLKDFGGAIEPGDDTGVVKIEAGNPEAAVNAYNVKMQNFNRAGFDIRGGILEMLDCYIDCANNSSDKPTKGILVQDTRAYIVGTTIVNSQSANADRYTNAIETWGNSNVHILGCTLGTANAPVKNGVSINAGTGFDDDGTHVAIDNFVTEEREPLYTSVKAVDRAVEIQPDNSGTGTAYVEVYGGSYDGAFRIDRGDETNLNCWIIIMDGFFTSEPDISYILPGLAVVKANFDKEGNEFGYPYTIGELPEEIDVSVGVTTIDEDKIPAGLDGAATTAAAGVQANPITLQQGAAEAVKNMTAAQAQELIKGANLPNSENAVLVAEAYLEVTPVAYDKANAKFTVSITPMYRLIATTAGYGEDFEFEGENFNAKVVREPQKLTALNNTEVQILIPLPEDFPTENQQYYINHKGFCYTAELTNNGDQQVLLFTNPDGFSDFEITTAAPVARNGSTQYTTYEAAVKDAENGDTITLLVAPTAENPMIVNGKTVTLQAGYEVTADNTIAKLIESKAITTNGKVGEPAEDGSVTITKKSSGGGGGGGGGGGASTADLTLAFDTNGAPAAPGKETVAGFTDVTADAYYADAVKWAVDNAVTNGDTATTFAPNKKCTRAEAVTFLWRAAGKPAADAAGTFADVAADAYYADAVAWAVANGITKGMTETTFAPNVQCSRAEIVTFMARMAKSETTSADTAFTDVTAADYYSGAVAWAVENKVTTGTTAATFAPNEKCSRADIVTFLYRYLGKAE